MRNNKPQNKLYNNEDFLNILKESGIDNEKFKNIETTLEDNNPQNKSYKKEDFLNMLREADIYNEKVKKIELL